MKAEEIIKSVILKKVNNVIQAHFFVHSGVKLPVGKKDGRFRKSTNRKYSKAMMKTLENDKMEIALKLYLAEFDNLENIDEPTFGDVAHFALQEAEANRRKQDGTVDYISILEKHTLPFFGKMKLTDIKVRDVKAWMLEISKLNISQNRFHKYHYVLKRVMDYAYENEHITSNVMQHIKRTSKLFTKSESKDDDYFTKEERDLILNDVCEGCSEKEILNSKFMVAFMHVAFLVGARTGEILNLLWSDIDFENNTITISTSMRRGISDVTKTNQVRVVPMVKKLSEALLLWKGTRDNRYVFPVPNKGTPYKDSRAIVDSKYRPMLKRLGISFRILYNSRHTFASISMEQGVPLSVISLCLGHQSTEITSRYYIRFKRACLDTVRNQLEELSA